MPLLLQTVITVAYLVVVGRVWVVGRRARRLRPVLGLPPEDRAPEGASAWAPTGVAFGMYVDEGFAALDAYLSRGSAP